MTSKLMWLGISNVAAKVAMVGILYYTVFKTSTLAGFAVLLAHAVYEATEYYIEKVATQQYTQQQIDAYNELLKDKLFGGNA